MMLNWAGKGTLGILAARYMIANAQWENAYWVDLEGCVSASEAAFKFLEGRTTRTMSCALEKAAGVLICMPCCSTSDAIAANANTDLAMYF